MAVQQQRVLPAYEVEALKGTVTRVMCKSVRHPELDPEGEQIVDDEGRKKWQRPVIEKVKVEEPAGYMVYMLNGSSLRVRNEAELERLGFKGPAPLIDEESGEEVQPMQMQTLKSRVASKTRGRSHRASGGGVAG